jgi:hypothetical protein
VIVVDAGRCLRPGMPLLGLPPTFMSAPPTLAIDDPLVAFNSFLSKNDHQAAAGAHTTIRSVNHATSSAAAATASLATFMGL